MTAEATKTEVGSYFISNYPPFSQWSNKHLGQVQTALNSPPAEAPLGLYLHIPFCRKRCKFCYFKVFTDKHADQIERYLAALSREIELVSKVPAMGGRPFRFVYFGGGTPSFLSEKQLRRLVDRLQANIRWDKAEEVTFECEPGTLSEPKVHALRELGVTRLSLGVEHFDDEILRENGRAHESHEIYRAWPWIKAAGFPNVNIDLIAGMVGDTDEKWREAVRNQIETPVADWPTKRAWVDYAFDQFAAAGYAQSSAYTMVRHPERVNFSYRDNLWRGSDLLATGIASFGHISGVHYQNHAEWEQYCSTLEEGALPLNRALRITPRQALIREMVLQLKKGHLDESYFSKKYDVDIVDEWRSTWEEYVREGYAMLEEGRVSLTREGLLRVDALLPAFFQPEFRDVRYT
jgi:oxygen-independent coproporphyrinogen-3 oxidase